MKSITVVLIVPMVVMRGRIMILRLSVLVVAACATMWYARLLSLCSCKRTCQVPRIQPLFPNRVGPSELAQAWANAGQFCDPL